MSLDEPETLVGARKECPLILGRGEGEQFVASAVPGFLAETRHVQYLENGEIAVLRPDGVRIMDAAGTPVERGVEQVDWDEATAEKAGYETFMLKEIHEQADAVADAIADRTARARRRRPAGADAFDESLLDGVRRIVIVACGTSYHAGLIGRYAIEEWARLPVEMDIASEYRYRNPVVDPGDLVIGISQSGETADTLAAMRLARERGARVLAVTNVMGSEATRDGRRRPVHARRHGDRRRRDQDVHLPGRRHVPARRCGSPSCAASWTASASRELVAERQAAAALHRPRCSPTPTSRCKPIADAHWQSDFFLYIGRHVGLPVALEGALKLKEISYIATDAYAAGEMKHGPIALLDDSTPVVVRRHRLAGPRQGRLEHAGGPRPRSTRDRGRDRGQRAASPHTPTR